MNSNGAFFPTLMFLVCFFVGAADAKDCPRLPDNSVGWEPPVEGIIARSSEALKIAHIVWMSVSPEARQINDRQWEKNMSAILIDDIWKVSRKHPKDTIGGDFIISISKCDGRVTDILMTQ